MAVRQRLSPSDDWLCGRDIRRENVPTAYEWLQPCESPLQHAQRDGPLRRGIRCHLVASAAAELPAIPAAASSGLPGRRGPKKINDQHLRAAGNPGPLWQPPTEEEAQHRAAVASAMRAASAVRRGHGGFGSNCREPSMMQASMSRSASMPGPRARRRAEAAAAVAASTGGHPQRRRNASVVDDIEVWDSVSQAPTNHGEEENEWDALSAETMTASRLKLPLQSRLDRDIADHLSRNRGGWYDWHAGRLFG